MRINNNVMALNAHRQLGINQGGAAKSMEKLSSGFRINRAGDDAAGLAISEKMRGQIRGLKQASRNAQDGISLIQTAEGALNETHAILQRMRELAVQSSTDTNTDADRMEIQKEIDQLSTEITRISTDTEFNTMELLDGSYKDKVFHIGANKGQSVTLDVGNMDALSLSVGEKLTVNGDNISDANGVRYKWVDADTKIHSAVTAASTTNGTVTQAGFDEVKSDKAGYYAVTDAVATSTGGEITAQGKATMWRAVEADAKYSNGEISVGINVSNQVDADGAIKVIDDASVAVSAERSKLGAMQNRLEHTIANLGTSAENLQAAESRIRDLDMADEIMAFTKNNILQQAATAMLAQANMAPQSVLQLLG